VNAEKILNGAIGILEQRGRCFGSYINQQGEVCVLGAMALAAEVEQDRWESLNVEWESEWAPKDAALVEAARTLLKLLPFEVEFDDLPIEDLVFYVGRWHDGVFDDDRWIDSPTNAQVFAKLAEAVEAARLAEKAEASA
jgi:hypothetical protein